MTIADNDIEPTKDRGATAFGRRAVTSASRRRAADSASRQTLVQVAGGAVYVLDGGWYRFVPPLLVDALTPLFGMPTAAGRIDPQRIGAPLEVLDTGDGPLWTVIGAVRYELQGFPRPERTTTPLRPPASRRRPQRLSVGAAPVAARPGSGYRRSRLAAALDLLALRRS